MHSFNFKGVIVRSIRGFVNKTGCNSGLYKVRLTSVSGFTTKKSTMNKKADDVDYNQVVFRLAQPTDHKEVKDICKGAFGGSDTLPAKFLHYLKDPLRRLYVAAYKGKVVISCFFFKL